MKTPMSECALAGRETLLDSYVTGEMTQPAMQEFERHLVQCESCLSELQFRNEVKALVSAEGKTLFANIAPAKDAISVKNRFLVVRNMLSGRQAWALALLILIIGASVYFGQLSDPSGTLAVLAELNYDAKVPYEFDPVALRSSIDVTDPDVRRFQESFEVSALLYIDRRYGSFLAKMNQYLPQAEALARSAEPSGKRLARDAYFYMGLAHLAMALTRDAGLADSVRKMHGAQALHFLTMVDSLAADLASTHNPQWFFLGLAHIANQAPDEAKKFFNKMEPTSPFYTQMEVLKEKMK